MMLLPSPGRAQNLSFSLLRADGDKPSARFDGTIAYDPGNRRVYLFGGQDTAPRNDLWFYSLPMRRWVQVPVEGAKPPARFGHTLIFDPARRRLVVFGGQAAGFFSDVWAFDLAQNTWQQLAGDNSGPSRRYGHSGIYDSARDRMVVSHGFTNSGRFDDTWAFNFASNTWQDLSPSGARPLRRCLHHAVHDAAGDQMFLYGGCASGFGPCPLGDLWSFDLAANRWTERTGQLKPPPREHYGMAFDAVRNRLVLFGGTGGGLLNDTWAYDPRANSWRQPPISGDSPSPRYRHQTAYASDRGNIFFFGGLTNDGPTNELWMLGPGFLPIGPEITPDGVVNAFNGQSGPVAPGEIVSIFSNNLGENPGITVTWNGIQSPLYFARSGQLNVQVPYELEGSSEATLVVTVNGTPGDPVTLPVTPTQPGLLPLIWNGDGSVNTPENPASPGRVILLFATGQGVTIPRAATGAVTLDLNSRPEAPTALRIGGAGAELLFYGLAPGMSGVLMLIARVPEGLEPGAAPEVVLTVGEGRSQNGVTLSLRQ
jgi:uncharacterized protein (TIGR03437 family)